jgi:hypothetical protein
VLKRNIKHRDVAGHEGVQTSAILTFQRQHVMVERRDDNSRLPK